MAPTRGTIVVVTGWSQDETSGWCVRLSMISASSWVRRTIRQKPPSMIKSSLRMIASRASFRMLLYTENMSLIWNFDRQSPCLQQKCSPSSWNLSVLARLQRGHGRSSARIRRKVRQCWSRSSAVATTTGDSGAAIVEEAGRERERRKRGKKLPEGRRETQRRCLRVFAGAQGGRAICTRSCGRHTPE